MTGTARLESVIGHLQEVQYGLRSGRRALARRNLIEATSLLASDMSGHATDRGFPDRPGATVLDRELELMELWNAWSGGDPGAEDLLHSEIDAIVARLQEIVRQAA